jgi:UDP-N-acetylmuramate: L-alanyl-gamma-D-glutamyl-meso-diaminopimelate ligase
MHILPADGYLAAGIDFPHVAELAASTACRWEGYGLGPQAHWQAAQIERDGAATRFVVRHHAQCLGTVRWEVVGRHNIQNALGVIAVASHLGLPFASIRQGLQSFTGVRRRQEVRGVVGEITVIDDFAHHPTAIRETLAALRDRYAGQRLWAMFEPRSATSRRAVFQEAFVDALAEADCIVIAGLYSPDAIPVAERLSPERLADEIGRRYAKPAVYCPEVGAIVDHLATGARPGDVMVILSNGGFGGIHERLLEALRHAAPRLSPCQASAAAEPPFSL